MSFYVIRRSTGAAIRGPFPSRFAAKVAWQREIEPGLLGASEQHAARCFDHHARNGSGYRIEVRP